MICVLKKFIFYFVTFAAACAAALHSAHMHFYCTFLLYLRCARVCDALKNCENKNKTKWVAG